MPEDTQPDLNRRILLSGIAGLTTLGATGVAGAVCTRTPYQTAGPFYPEIINDDDWDLTRVQGRKDRARGKVVEIAGRVLDANCRPVAGAVIDVWQANAAGRYRHSTDRNPAPLDPNFEGFAQVTTSEDGAYRILTIMPGPYPVADGWVRPPHIHYKVHAGTSETLTTQMYFADSDLNEKDRLYMSIAQPLRSLVTVEFNERGADGVPRGTLDLHVG